MFTTIAVTTALLGLTACSKNDPAPAPTEAVAPAPTPAPAEAAPVAAPADAGKPADGAVVQPK